MKKNLQWKVILVLAIVAASTFFLIPPSKKIKLGLDLKGGIHLVMQVLTQDSVNIETDQQIARMQEQLKKSGINFSAITKETPGKFSIAGLNPDDGSKVKDLFDEYARDWDSTMVADKATLTLKANAAQLIKEQAVSQTLETIRNRIDQFGVSEPLIQKQGFDKIVVELPGVDDPDRVKNLIKVTALLEWKLVKAGPAPDEQTLLASFGGKVPDDSEIVKGDPKRGHGGLYLVSKVAAVSGRDLRTVRRSADEWNKPAVAFTLNPEGGARFEEVTGENVGRQIAIILDGKVQSSPTVNSRISRTQGGIIQGFTAEEAEDLVVILRAGALPAGISYLEERRIGPSLGADSVRQGLAAGLVAIVAVMGFMVFYYKLAGLNAIVALILNVLITLGSMAYFRATLTLPGIAGLILSIGMAVDANVLIFERMKEELATGKTVFNAIPLGFHRAFSAIFDSNLTTIISAVFLFQFGTGPIRGYAVTLTIGLLANLFTAVFVSRLLFDMTVKKNAKRLSI